jgi:small nuclear ribonucleoprotein
VHWLESREVSLGYRADPTDDVGETGAGGAGVGTFKHATPASSGMSGRPLDVLEASLGDDVTVRLKDGEEYTGELTGYDQHMNLVIEDGQDTTIIRGDNVVSISP